MSTIAEDKEACFGILEQEFGNKTFLFNGKLYVCRLGDLTEWVILRLGGLDNKWSRMLTVRISTFGSDTQPNIGDKLSIGVTQYRVERIVDDTLGVTKRFILSDLT